MSRKGWHRRKRSAAHGWTWAGSSRPKRNAAPRARIQGEIELRLALRAVLLHIRAEDRFLLIRQKPHAPRWLLKLLDLQHGIRRELVELHRIGKNVAEKGAVLVRRRSFGPFLAQGLQNRLDRRRSDRLRRELRQGVRGLLLRVKLLRRQGIPLQLAPLDAGSGGRIVEATIKAVVETTEGVRLQVSFGEETALIYLWQVAEGTAS